MDHSSKKEEREVELAEKNREYLADKREQLKAIESGKAENSQKPKRGRFCCLFISVLMLIAVGLIYYFVVNIKGVVYDEYLKRKDQVQNLMPAGKDQLDQSLNQGQNLWQDSKETLESLQAKYEQAKALYEKGQETLEKVNEIKAQLDKWQGVLAGEGQSTGTVEEMGPSPSDNENDVIKKLLQEKQT